MSMIQKQKMTEKNRAAKQANGRQARGAVTAAGKANSAAARLLHGFYSRSRDEAMIALGEDPREYERLLTSLLEDLRPNAALEGQLVLRMGRALWRMQRAERMQDGLAAKRVRSGSQMEQVVTGSKFVRQHELYGRLTTLGGALLSPDYVPSAEEIVDFETGFGDAPSADIQNLFPLLHSFREAALKTPTAVNEPGAVASSAPTPEEQRRDSARKELDNALQSVIVHNRMVLDLLMKENDAAHSQANVAALMAPQDNTKSELMQRMEDSNLRQLWRLTKLYLMIKRSEGTDVTVDEDHV